MGKILLNPGPTNTGFFTKLSQWFGSDICHRTDKFSEDFDTLKRNLLKRYGNVDMDIAIMGGSGTVAMESMIASLMSDDCLVIDAGTYGSRAISIATRYLIKCQYIKSKNIEDLKANNRVQKVYFVENETSSGEKYSIERMAKIYPNAKFLIDATSSFGATDYTGYHDRILALSFCSNKCLQSTPGLGVVIWNKNICETHDRNYYGDITKYGIGKIPFTVPVQSVYALLSALKRNKNNKNVFNSRRDRLIKDMSQFGIQCLSKNPSNSIVAFEHPHMSYERLKMFLHERGIVVYSGIGRNENSFRVSTMSVKFDNCYKKIRRAFLDSCLHRYGSGHVSRWPFKFN